MNDCQRRVSNLTIARAQLAEPNMTNIRQRNVGFILTASSILLIAAGIYELVRPDEFRSGAIIKIERDESGDTDQQPYDPNFISTEVEAIPSEAILSNVVQRLELVSKWSAKLNSGHTLKVSEAIGILRGRLDVIPRKNTTLIDIYAVSQDAAEAALIANEVVAAYRDWRIAKGYELATVLAIPQLNALTKQLEAEDQKIKTAKDDLDRMRRELNIPDTEVESVSVRTNFPTYWNAVQHLEELNDLRRLITRKINIEEADLRLPPNHRCSSSNTLFPPRLRFVTTVRVVWLLRSWGLPCSSAALLPFGNQDRRAATTLPPDFSIPTKSHCAGRSASRTCAAC